MKSLIDYLSFTSVGQNLKNIKEIIFEIGTEEQSGGTNTDEELEYSYHL